MDTAGLRAAGLLARMKGYNLGARDHSRVEGEDTHAAVTQLQDVPALLDVLRRNLEEPNRTPADLSPAELRALEVVHVQYLAGQLQAKAHTAPDPRADQAFAIDKEATRQQVAGSSEFLEALCDTAKRQSAKSGELRAFEKFARLLSTCEDTDDEAYSGTNDAGVHCFAVCIAGGPVTRVEDLMMEEIASNVRVKGMPNIRVIVKRIQLEDLTHARERSRTVTRGRFLSFDKEPEPEQEQVIEAGIASQIFSRLTRRGKSKAARVGAVGPGSAPIEIEMGSAEDQASEPAGPPPMLSVSSM